MVAFSLKVSQLEAPSSTTASICLPKTPPAALISLIASFSASTTLFSLMAIVPLRECRIPTLMVLPPVLTTGDVLFDTAGLFAVLGVLLAQAFKKMLLPTPTALYSRNLRRLNCLPIFLI